MRPTLSLTYKVWIISSQLQAYVEDAIERWRDASDEIVAGHEALEKSKKLIAAFSSTVTTGRCSQACLYITLKSPVAAVPAPPGAGDRHSRCNNSSMAPLL